MYHLGEAPRRALACTGPSRLPCQWPSCLLEGIMGRSPRTVCAGVGVGEVLSVRWRESSGVVCIQRCAGLAGGSWGEMKASMQIQQ